MPFAQLQLFSQVLAKQTSVNVLLPKDLGQRPFPVMFLLHGMSDDHSMWCRQTSIERYVEDLPLIVVMPDGLRNYYTDAVAGYAVETWIAQELVRTIEALFPTRAPWCTTGLSMGGYGAVKLALRHPERFVSAVSHSGAVLMGHRLPPPPYGDEMARVFGPNPQGGPNDLVTLARAAATSASRPRLRLDCGVDDFLLEDNREFHRALAEAGYAHEYAEFPGGHTWEYWDLHVQEALEFHRRHLGF